MWVCVSDSVCVGGIGCVVRDDRDAAAHAAWNKNPYYCDYCPIKQTEMGTRASEDWALPMKLFPSRHSLISIYASYERNVFCEQSSAGASAEAMDLRPV
jgi:hypothetical protein